MPKARGSLSTAPCPVPGLKLAVTPGDIDGTEHPAVEPGSYQVEVGSMSADFSVGT